MRKFILILFLSLLSFSIIAQNRTVDSLLAVVKIQKEDSNKLRNLQRLSNYFNHNGLRDYQKQIDFGSRALSLAVKINNLKGIAYAYWCIGLGYDWLAYTSTGDYSNVIPCYTKAISLYDRLGCNDSLPKLYIDVGNSYYYQSNYPKALEYFLKSQKIAEELDQKTNIIRAAYYLAILYGNTGDDKKELQYCRKVIQLSKTEKNITYLVEGLRKLGAIHLYFERFDSALFYYNEALENCKTQKFQNDSTGVLFAIGLLYYNRQDYATCINYVNRSLADTSDPSTYAGKVETLGEVYLALNQPQKAIPYFEKAYSIAVKANIKSRISNIYENLSSAYEKIGQIQKAFDFYKKSVIIYDSIYSESKTKEITQHEMQYEFDKQQAAEKAEQDKLDAIASEKLVQQKGVTYIFSGALVLILIFSFFLYRSFLQKKKFSEMISAQNEMLEEQKHFVEAKNKEMTDSIMYAKRIQDAVLIEPNTFISKFEDAFLLFKPRDIVSGDFYWQAEIDNCIYYATVDCTGHGVPGGFMSMLGNSFLQEIVVEKGITKPGDVLDMLRTMVIKALSQKEAKDGMDITFCKLDKKKNELTYAAANNPLWLVRNNEILEHPADKQPVGLHHGIALQFTQRTIKLQKGDCIYTFTDGYADQFGGDKGKKFKYKPLKELILANANSPMAEQKKILDKNFENWIGNLDQVDDVCLIGIRI